VVRRHTATVLAFLAHQNLECVARRPPGRACKPLRGGSIPHGEAVDYLGFRARRFAWADASDLQGLPFVRGVVGVTDKAQPFEQSRLEARLAHRGIARLEIEFRLVLRNGRDLAAGLV